MALETYKSIDDPKYQFVNFMGCTWPVPIQMELGRGDAYGKSFLHINYEKKKVSLIEFYIKDIENYPDNIGDYKINDFGVKTELVDVHDGIKEYSIESVKLDVRYTMFYSDSNALRISNVDKSLRDEMIRYCLKHKK